MRADSFYFIFLSYDLKTYKIVNLKNDDYVIIDELNFDYIILTHTYDSYRKTKIIGVYSFSKIKPLIKFKFEKPSHNLNLTRHFNYLTQSKTEKKYHNLLIKNNIKK